MPDIRGYGDERLPYPTHPLQTSGGAVEEYVIPAGERETVFRMLYPFLPVPSLDDEMLDIHEDLPFTVRDFKVIRDCGMNMLVSPFFASSGGTVIDWWPPDSCVEFDEDLPEGEMDEEEE
jgi:hypothetical protein